MMGAIALHARSYGKDLAAGTASAAPARPTILLREIAGRPPHGGAPDARCGTIRRAAVGQAHGAGHRRGQFGTVGMPAVIAR